MYIVTGDVNSRAKMRSPEPPCNKGKIIERTALKLNLKSLFDPNRSKCTRPNTTTGNDSWIDIFLISTKLMKIIRRRKIINNDYSDHGGLMFCIMNKSNVRKTTPDSMAMNTAASSQNLDFLKIRSLNQEIIELQSLVMNNAMKIIWYKSAQVKFVKHRWLPRGIVNTIRKLDSEKKKEIKRALQSNTDDQQKNIKNKK